MLEEEKKEELQEESNIEEVKETEEETNEQVEEIDNSNLSEYEIKVNEYRCRLEEALINIEVKENIALANEEDEEARKEYFKAKEDYEALRKEFKQFKIDNAPKTWWTTLPLRMKVLSFFNIILCFPYLSWAIIPFWSFPYRWFYEIFSEGLNKMYNNGKETLVMIYLGIMWYLLVAILIACLVIISIKIKKDDVDKNYKKTYIGFIIGNGILVAGVLIYELVMMITGWF